ncbi:MAG: RloB domain-containing protein [Clostridia bacterium]|nr:RloB domain-containing protein [Clostridia bacterium]
MAVRSKDGSRAGKRRDRNSRLATREPILGYYLIVTDTDETEKNYFEGLKKSIPDKYRNRIVIRVEKAKTTYSLVERTNELCSASAQQRIPWIVFDRDQVKDFDGIIREAEKNEINVGWSNPCFEIWLYAYFGEMPGIPDSVTCCRRFSDVFEKRTGHPYGKNDEEIYKRLTAAGDFETAWQLAERYTSTAEKEGKRPSESIPACTVHRLVKEIKDKTDN